MADDLTWDDTRDDLTMLHEADTEFKTDAAVYSRALHFAGMMERQKFPAPKIWAHGKNSVVFDWDGIMMTISGNRAETLFTI